MLLCHRYVRNYAFSLIWNICWNLSTCKLRTSHHSLPHLHHVLRIKIQRILMALCQIRTKQNEQNSRLKTTRRRIRTRIQNRNLLRKNLDRLNQQTKTTHLNRLRHLDRYSCLAIHKINPCKRRRIILTRFLRNHLRWRPSQRRIPLIPC